MLESIRVPGDLEDLVPSYQAVLAADVAEHALGAQQEIVVRAHHPPQPEDRHRRSEHHEHEPEREADAFGHAQVDLGAGHDLAAVVRREDGGRTVAVAT